jgi:cytochrome c oxidase subunit II
MALLLALLIATLVVSSAYFFSVDWLPALAAANPVFSEKHFQLNLIVFGITFAVTHAALAWFVLRRRSQPIMDGQGSPKAEFMWALAAAFMFFGVNAIGTLQPTVHAPGHNAIQGTQPVRVEVTGVQFRWYFRYPGADGKFGRTAAKLVDASEGNPLGIDHADPAAQDDFVAATLTVPVGRPVELTLRAHDVIHSFFIPNVRLKQDGVPGMDSMMRFTPDKLGTYDIACAELCGLGHYAMNAKLRTLAPDQFAAWETEAARK